VAAARLPVAAPRPARVTVCVCTYRRPALLERLLTALTEQVTGGAFTVSIVVADNDASRSAEAVVATFGRRSPIAVVYCVEPEQSIALARNTALRHAHGDYVAFIDDDEVPGPTWLLTLLRACARHNADGVLGPVEPRYDVPPPDWIVRGRFHERPRHRSGAVMDWQHARTGNALLARRVFDCPEAVFRREFVTGEDRDFFRRLIAAGHVFVWCAEAVVHEHVPATRCTRRFMLRRALLRGKISLRHGSPASRVGRSIVAVTLYTLALPLLFLAGQHHFMKYLVKIFDHAGRLLAAVGLNPMAERYVSCPEDDHVDSTSDRRAR
jgi:succinoglycan biosynthesis protein ExoM